MAASRQSAESADESFLTDLYGGDDEQQQQGMPDLDFLVRYVDQQDELQRRRDDERKRRLYAQPSHATVDDLPLDVIADIQRRATAGQSRRQQLASDARLAQVSRTMRGAVSRVVSPDAAACCTLPRTLDETLALTAAIVDDAVNPVDAIYQPIARFSGTGIWNGEGLRLAEDEHNKLIMFWFDRRTADMVAIAYRTSFQATTFNVAPTRHLIVYRIAAHKGDYDGVPTLVVDSGDVRNNVIDMGGGDGAHRQRLAAVMDRLVRQVYARSAIVDNVRHLRLDSPLSPHNEDVIVDARQAYYAAERRRRASPACRIGGSNGGDVSLFAARCAAQAASLLTSIPYVRVNNALQSVLVQWHEETSIRRYGLNSAARKLTGAQITAMDSVLRLVLLAIQSSSTTALNYMLAATTP